LKAVIFKTINVAKGWSFFLIKKGIKALSFKMENVVQRDFLKNIDAIYNYMIS